MRAVVHHRKGVFVFDHPDEVSGIAKAHRRGHFYEPKLLEALHQIRDERPGIWLDVGAHIGNHAIFFDRICGKTVVAFEPEPRNYSLLADNINRNKARHTTTVRVPVGAGERVAFESGPHSGRGSVRESDEPSADTAEALNDLVGIATTVGLIKIDVEGFEMSVLRGASKILRKHRPTLVVEAHTIEALNEQRAYLKTFGYALDPRKNLAPAPTRIWRRS